MTGCFHYNRGYQEMCVFLVPSVFPSAHLIGVQLLHLLGAAVVARVQHKQRHQQHRLRAQGVLQRPPAQQQQCQCWKYIAVKVATSLGRLKRAQRSALEGNHCSTTAAGMQQQVPCHPAMLQERSLD